MALASRPRNMTAALPPRPRALWLLIGAFAATLVGGCGGLTDSLKTTNTVLIKMPIREPVASGDAAGWHFRHVLEAPRDAERRGQWYVAWNNERPLVTARFSPYWKQLQARAPEIADASHKAFGGTAYPVLIEPNKTFSQVIAKPLSTPKPGEPVTSRYGAGTRLVLNERQMAMKVWPDGRRPDPAHPGQFVVDPLWHLDKDHSQLGPAQARLEKAGLRPGEGITVGHLDNGLDGNHSAAPLNLVRGDRQANAVELRDYLQAKSRGEDPPPPLPPEQTGGTHGMGTVGLLAGSWVAIDEKAVPGGRIQGYYGWLGGAPYARVIPLRVAPWVVSLSTAELAYSIDYASRVRHADVLTMSHGGAPTQAWSDAVNAAYERGTAMFAAESDFFSLVPDPFRPDGIVLPSSPVYPAGFRRVIGVIGVTADYHSYARNSLWHLLRWPPGLTGWMARGSYGADGTSTVVYRPDRTPDPSQTRWLGELRPYPLAAYSPNVPWLSIRESGGTRYADGVDLNGAGTSAATPQVAAAALWLQRHRHEFPAVVWSGRRDGWKKAEAVYFALLKTADRRGKIGPDRYLGAGLLRADCALDLSYAEIKKHRRPAFLKNPTVEQIPPGSLYYEKAPKDYFDGGRSFLGLLGFQTWGHVALNDRADLRQQPKPGETRTAAMQRLFYNIALLRRWHNGNIPRKRETAGLWARAYRDAAGR